MELVDYVKVYGPYKRKDGRMVVIVAKNDKRHTISYPKYLMEKHLGKKIKPNETIHHIDGDFTNNSIGNLQVLDRSEHIKLERPIQTRNYTCPICNTKFTLCGRKLSRRLSNEKRQPNKKLAGPFCSKQCAGRHNATTYKVYF